MTTDVKTEPQTQTLDTPENVNSAVITSGTNKEAVVDGKSESNDKLLQEMKSMFDASIKEIKETFEKKTEELNSTIKKKDEEIEKLKQANVNLALSGNFGNKNNDAPDYNSMDFDDVDWSSQAKSCLDNIDAKIFDIKQTKN